MYKYEDDRNKVYVKRTEIKSLRDILYRQI